MNISIEVIPPELQRYNTVGDWEFDDKGNLDINVSQQVNGDYEFLIAVHELVEAYLCMRSGITSQVVDKWDLDHIDDCDPGGIPNAPYHKQHSLATVIEMMLANALDIKWGEYDSHTRK